LSLSLTNFATTIFVIVFVHALDLEVNLIMES